MISLHFGFWSCVSGLWVDCDNEPEHCSDVVSSEDYGMCCADISVGQSHETSTPQRWKMSVRSIKVWMLVSADWMELQWQKWVHPIVAAYWLLRLGWWRNKRDWRVGSESARPRCTDVCDEDGAAAQMGHSRQEVDPLKWSVKGSTEIKGLVIRT